MDYTATATQDTGEPFLLHFTLRYPSPYTILCQHAFSMTSLLMHTVALPGLPLGPKPTTTSPLESF